MIPALPENLLSQIRLTKKTTLNLIQKAADGLLTKQEGISLLHELDAGANAHITKAVQDFTAGIYELHLIRRFRLFEYASFDTWGAFVEDWCVQHHRGRYTVNEFLAYMRIMDYLPGLKAEHLFLCEDGVYVARALLSTNRGVDTSPVLKYDMKTGEILEVREGFILHGDTPSEMVAWHIVDTWSATPHEITAPAVRQTVRAGRPASTNSSEKVRFFRRRDGQGNVIGVSWTYRGDRATKEGHTVQSLVRNPYAYAEFWRRLGVKEP
jgi:hypothetical protein